MDALEMKRLELELIRVQAGRAEQEFSVMQKEEEIRRLKDSIKISEAKEAEVSARINEATKKAS